jgi:uncharacterized protein (TIGR00290 family)
MMKKIPVVFCWSGGKDSSYALYQLMRDNQYEVKYLLSTINQQFKRLSMHGVRESLIEAQSRSIGIPLLKVYVKEGNNEEYEKNMGERLLEIGREGIKTIAYGDIFLEDLRTYREEKMHAIGWECIFPIWKKNTQWLVIDFIEKGFKTYTCCVNDAWLNDDWCGRLIDMEFVKELPKQVDACGENGEFHSFCFDGPLFKVPIPVQKGELLYKPLIVNQADHPCPLPAAITRGFWYIDLLD